MKAKKVQAKLWAYREKVNKEGAVALYIQVSINRVRRYIPLKLYWPAHSFDFDKMELQKRSKTDKSFSDYMMIINNALSKCNEVFVSYRLRNLDISMDVFLEEFYQFNLKKDFILYMEYKIKYRSKKRDISDQTKKNHTNTLAKLKKYQPTGLIFSNITIKWCRDFEVYLRKDLCLAKNTVWSHMKDINTYLNLASEEDNIPSSNPFKTGYTCGAVDSDIPALTQDHIRALTQYYYSQEIPFNQKSVLGQFLFSCYTGLRISDLKSISIDNIIGDTLVFNPIKGERFDKLQRVPLTNKAKEFITSEHGLLFEKYKDQSSNRILKKIGKHLDLPIKLTNHVGRHSFATLFLELGGNVEVLQKLLGHSKISTTMKYVHVNEKRKADQMGNFDKLDF